MKVILSDSTINLDRFDEIRITQREPLFYLVAVKRELCDSRLMKGEVILASDEDMQIVNHLYKELQSAWIKNEATYTIN